MKNRLVLALATLLGVGAYTAVRAQSDESLLRNGAVLENFVPGTYTVQLSGIGKSDIERAVKGSLKDVFAAQLDRESANFLMGSAGSCIVEGIDNLVGQGKANEGDSVSFVYGGNNVIVYNKNAPSFTVRSECTSTGDLISRYRELLSAQAEESGDDAGKPATQKSAKGKSAKKPADLKDLPVMFTYSTRMASKSSLDAERFLKDKEYDAAIASASFAASVDPVSYNSQVAGIKDKVADIFHAQSTTFFNLADKNIQKGNIDDAIANLREAYSFEKRSIELNGKQSLVEEDALKVRIANYVVGRSVQLQDQGKIDKAYELVAKIFGLGLTNDETIGAYREAGKLVK